MVEAQTFRNAMGLLGAAVNIITTDGAHGMHGFTASAVCSVTDSPPTLLVCLNRHSGSHLIYSGNRTIGINVLSSQHERKRGRPSCPMRLSRSIAALIRFWKSAPTASFSAA
jgi:flavin reductase